MKKLLKFITCGSVDDGKSTLIGHILYDSKLLYADQEKALQLDSKIGSRGGSIDYSLLLDGLSEEREQGITIDVAYRYFTTSARSFIVADTPGHEQYTRNMAVGASFADLAVILLDASKGVLVQTRRHVRICRLMGIRYFVFAVNKMDLVGYSREIFETISGEIEELKEKSGISNSVIIPVSATEGDNVTKSSANMPWYEGPSLLRYLEEADIDETEKEEGFYLPVQRVCRPDQSFRGFQGQIEAGSISVGDEIQILPEGEKARIAKIFRMDQECDAASAGEPVTVTLDREIDVSRGSVMTKGAGLFVVNHFTADILWMGQKPLEKGGNFFVKIGTTQIPGNVSEIVFKTDVNTGEKISADRIEKNELARCRIRLADRIVADTFDRHRTMGELILIDRISFMTCACGVIKNVGYDGQELNSVQALRASLVSQTAVTVEFVKSSRISRALLEKAERKLLLEGKYTYLLDVSDLTAKQEDIRLINMVKEHLAAAGLITLLLVNEEQRALMEEADGYFRYLPDSAETGEESIVSFVKKTSVRETHIVTNADYI